VSTARSIEIAGVAGAGKSTLARALCERHAGFRIADSLHTRLPAHWPYVARAVPMLLPLLVGSVRRRPALSWEEAKLVVYASEWDRYLGSRRERGAGVVVLDQGPLFAFARLLWGMKPVTREDTFRAWMDETLERWSSALDAIVWLEAVEDTLRERIDRRDKRHEAKAASREDALELLTSHRLAYERVLGAVEGTGAVRVLRYDTGTRSAAEIADELAVTLDDPEARRLTDARSATNVS
jgi:shikimate kinase